MPNSQDLIGAEGTGSFTVRMLDGFELRDSAGRSVKLSGRKAQALVAYLILRPNHTETRERLATLLWRDRFDEQARHSLRQTVLTLRKALGDVDATLLRSDGEKLILDASRLSVDALDFETSIKSEKRTDLESALEAYKTPLMDGFSAREEDFDRWLDEQRVQMSDMAADGYMRLSHLRDQDGELEPAIAAAEAAISVDQTREEAHRQVMSLLSKAGRRAEALRLYNQCKEILRRELDAVPEEQTVRLADEIRNSDGAVTGYG